MDNQSRDLAVTPDGSRIIYKGLGDGAEAAPLPADDGTSSNRHRS